MASRLALSFRASVLIRLLTIFVAHVAFLFGSYGSGALALIPFPGLAIFIWLGLSSLIAAYAYLLAFEKLTRSHACALYAVGSACASLSVGTLLAVNTFGT